MTKQTDALIVGAGPCGLFQVFELGLLGLKADVVDSMPVVGGQCAELYPDKPIYDIPAIPEISAAGLIEQLMAQIAPFEAGFHLNEEVTEVEGDGSGPFQVKTSVGTEFSAKTVIIAGGVGSFQPRKLRLADAEPFEDRQIHYRVRDPDRFNGKRLLVLGGGDSALDWLLELGPAAAEVTLAHRSDQFRAAPASVATMQARAAAGELAIHEFATLSELHIEDERIVAATLAIDNADPVTVAVDDILVFFGLAPKLGPIADWGLDLNRKTINVDTEKFQTNVPGIFAIGDINAYPGKKKLILSGFHEAALAAFAAKQHIDPSRKVHLQYTTTSPLMHERLGVDNASDG
ncbi:MAG: NAD(P)/FAD-dependent oxidoreductase [Pseudomonadota bacterium]